MGLLHNKKVLAIGMAFFVIGACMCTKIYSNAQILKEIQDDIDNSVRSSTVEYLDGYVIDNAELHSDIFGLIASNLGNNVASSLKSVQFSNKSIDAIDSAIEETLNQYVDELDLTEKEKETLKNNLRAIVVTSIYKSMLNKSYVTQDSLNVLSDSVDKQLSTIQASQNSLKNEMERSISDMENYVKKNGSAGSGNNQNYDADIRAINSQISSLKNSVGNGETVDKTSIVQLKNSISELQNKYDYDNKELTALKVKLSELSSKSGLSSEDIDKLKSALESADTSLGKRIDELDNASHNTQADLASLTQRYNAQVNEYNAFTTNTQRALDQIKTNLSGDLQEELDSVKADMQVLNNNVNQNLTSKIDAIRSEMSDLNANVSDELTAALDEMDLKLEDAEDIVTSLQSDYNTYSSDLTSKHSAAVNEITSKQSGAVSDIADKQAGALSDISDALGSATKDSTSGNSGALGDIESARQSAISDVTSRYSSDINDINERIGNISDDIEESGYMKGEYSREGDKYVITFSGGLSE